MFLSIIFCTPTFCLQSPCSIIIKHFAIHNNYFMPFLHFHFLLVCHNYLLYYIHVLLNKYSIIVRVSCYVNLFYLFTPPEFGLIYSFRSYDKEKEKYRFLLDSEQKNYYGLQLAIMQN